MTAWRRRPPKSAAAGVWSGMRAITILGAVTILGVGIGVACSVTSALGRVATMPPAAEMSSESRQEWPESIALARDFTAALNAHDVEALLALFTEEDAGPSVMADRSAWQKFEI